MPGRRNRLDGSTVDKQRSGWRGPRGYSDRLLPLACGILALSGFPASTPALPDPDTPWIEVRTTNHRLISSAPEKRVVELARRLEVVRQVLHTAHPRLAVDPPQPCTIFVFKNNRAFTPYKLRNKGRPASLDGMFIGHRDASYIALPAGPSVVRAIQHEYLHLFLRGNGVTLPAWYDEGMAEFYSTLAIRQDRVRLGRPPFGHVERLGAHGFVPAEELLAVPPESHGDRHGMLQSAFYAQCWALVHYLMLGTEHGPEQLARFPEESLGAGLPELTRNLVRYVRWGTGGRQDVAIDRSALDLSVSVRALSRAESLAALGDLLAHSQQQQLPDAEAHLRAALRADPGCAAAHRALGLVCLRREHYSAAIEHLERALELDPGDAVASLYLGESFLRRIAGGESRDRLLEPALRALERSNRQDPSLIEARAMYGKALLQAEDCSAGLSVLKSTWKRLPGRMDVAHDLAVMLALCNRESEAQEMVENVLEGHADPELLASARDGLMLLPTRAALKLIEQGRYEVAATRLATLLERFNSPARRAELQQTLEALKAAGLTSWAPATTLTADDAER